MVYVIKSDEYVKIGFSNNPQKRIKTIEIGCPTKPELLLLIDGGYDYEQELHIRFNDLKTHGEWFLFKQPIKDFISKNIKNDRKYEFGFTHNDFKDNQQVLRLRDEHNLTLNMLGQYLGITTQSVKEIQNREKEGTVTLNVLKKVARVMGYEFEYRFIKK